MISRFLFLKLQSTEEELYHCLLKRLLLILQVGVVQSLHSGAHAFYYSRFRLYSLFAHCTLSKVLEPRSSREFQWQLTREALQFHYYNRVSDCSVQCTNETRNPETTVQN